MRKSKKVLWLVMMNVTMVGMAFAGVHYVVDDNYDYIYKYDDTWTYLTRLTIPNLAPCGLDYQNGYVYILHWVTNFNHVVKRFSSADGSGETTSRILKRANGGAIRINGPPYKAGLAIDGDDLWVAAIYDGTGACLFRFSLSDAFSGSGTINAIQEIFTYQDGCTNPVGLAIDETYLYVLHSAGSGTSNIKRFYRYPRAGGSGTASKDLKTGAGANPYEVQGADLTIENGTKYLWILEDKTSGTDYVYKYAVNSIFPGPGTYNAEAAYGLDSNNTEGRGLGYEAPTPTPTETPTPTPTDTPTPTPYPTPGPTAAAVVPVVVGPNPQPDNNFTVEVALPTNSTGQMPKGYNLKLNYNTSQVDFVSVADAPGYNFNPQAGAEQGTGNNKYRKISGSWSGNTDDTPVLFRVTFYTKTIPVDITVEDWLPYKEVLHPLYDMDDNYIDHFIDNTPTQGLPVELDWVIVE